MKIVILQGYVNPIPPLIGGAVEKIWFRLGQKFSKYENQVIHISRTWGSLSTYEIIDGVNHHRIKGYSFHNNIFISKILDLIYTLRAFPSIPTDTDIIITHTFWAPILLPIFRKPKIVVSVERMPRGQMRFYKHVARLRAPSSAVADAIRKELPRDQHNRVVMIPNPLPYDYIEPFKMRNKERIILYCGRIHPEKGLEILLQTAKNLPEGWSIQIVGPWEKSEGGGGGIYLQTLKELFTGTNVNFFGPVYEEKKLIDFYQGASIFVYPSIAEKGESFGLAPLEAMSFGCVPVVSDLLCFKDFIFDGENGLIFDHHKFNAGVELEKCIQELIVNEEFRIKLAHQAIEVRLSHTLDHVVELFLSDFENLLNTTRSTN